MAGVGMRFVESEVVVIPNLNGPVLNLRETIA